ncbi:16.9 kDa class I heat shock protein 2 [Cajanus cajan]|uniref:17.3 kDa class I heat shock protein n=1 Tax=Cajanus cajan TaxID=3821 RepID=A0A151QW31_CAJCA|nr:16.9 kDa class I heat shock protein 2 [Cajanus cajan]KYP34442.1 17.3 kDa class I heat shock protein [Cajanus cajan]
MSLFEPLLLNQNDPFDHFRASFTINSDTQMDWKETRDTHVFEIDLPGLTKEEVKLEVKQNRVLCIKTERRGKEEEEEEEKNVMWHCRERSNGMFSREFRLPENCNVDEVKASMCDGVLTITVPKDETKKKHKKEVVIYEEDAEGVAPKGIGRFVCCKA